MSFMHQYIRYRALTVWCDRACQLCFPTLLSDFGTAARLMFAKRLTFIYFFAFLKNIEFTFSVKHFTKHLSRIVEKTKGISNQN